MSLMCYLVRHGETEWNLQKIHQGHKDSPLTERGRQSAGMKGKLLSNSSISTIYSSDLGRCTETARIINEILRAEIILSSKLRERSYGVYDGEPDSEVEKKMDKHDVNFIPPKGESPNQMRTRVLKFFASLEKREKDPILIVTHNGPIRAIVSECRGTDLFSPSYNFTQESIGKFEIENGKLKNFEFVKK